jgi:hypothetical protein
MPQASHGATPAGGRVSAMPDDRPEPVDRTEENDADREAAWLERELYEQDSERWEADEDA